MKVQHNISAETLIQQLTNLQDEMCKNVERFRKRDFADYYNDAPLEKTVFVFRPMRVEICGSFWMSGPDGHDFDPIKVIVVQKVEDTYTVLDIDWDDTCIGKTF